MMGIENKVTKLSGIHHLGTLNVKCRIYIYRNIYIKPNICALKLRFSQFSDTYGLLFFFKGSHCANSNDIF